MPNIPENASAWLSCPECEAPCRDRPLPKKAELRCSRCGVRVKVASGRHSLQPAWAFATAGLFVAAEFYKPRMIWQTNSEATP